MKKYILLASVALLTSCGHPTHKTPMFFGLFGPMEWPEEHWEGQNYHPIITDEQNALPDAQKLDTSLLANVEGLSPDEFIANMKAADIIQRVYNETMGTIQKQNSGNVIVVLGPNFYTLSPTDQSRVADLVAKSYQQETYLLKDGLTNMIVGQITPEGLNLY